MSDFLTVYIAGPMTGLPEFNYPAFIAAEQRVRRAGWDVRNPADIGVRPGWEWDDYMKAALRMLLESNAIAMLPGWEHSRGARLEHQIAEALGYEILLLADWVVKP